MRGTQYLFSEYARKCCHVLLGSRCSRTCTLKPASKRSPKTSDLNLDDPRAVFSGLQAYSSSVSKHQSNLDAQLEGGLYVVATPIGNLEDITGRALRVLASANLVLAEDTRQTRKLFQRYDIHTQLVSFHAFNERTREAELVTRLKGGEAIALVSDAGTPAISDPGEGLVRAAIDAGVQVHPVPGPCALIAAVIASGCSTSSFLFVGFLPPKASSRKAKILGLQSLPYTLVFYCSPHSLVAVLSDMVEVLGPDRRCCVARELTKIYEEFFRSTLSEAATEFASRTPRGEIVLIVEGAPEREGPLPDELVRAEVKQMMEGGMSVSMAAKSVAQQLGVSKRVAYGIALELDRSRNAVEGQGPG